MFAAGKTSGGGAASTVDAQFNYVSMLLHGDGTNGAQNNTFLDSSTNNLTITRNGNSTQGSFSPYGPNWSNNFNGTSSYLTLSSNASMSFGTGNFTIEGWFFTGDKSISGGASRTLIGNSGNSYTMQVYISTSGYMTFGNTGSTYLQGATDLANNTWHHFAISRSGTSTNQIAMWVDGTRVAQGTNSQNYTSGTIYIGAFGTTDGFWNGYISNLRIVKGSAVYDPANSTITVPTTPLTAITNTALLTCQANRFFDASTNAYTVTATGSPSVQRFNPFGASTAYSTSVIGGSGYFDGTGDYLSIASTSTLTLSGDYTVEGWVYVVNPVSGYRRIFQNAPGTTPTGYWYFYVATGATLAMYNEDVGTLPTVGNYTPYAWNHFAISRSGGTTRVFVNGVQTYSYAGSTTFTNNGWYISGGPDDEYTNCYISNHRVVVGTAVYTGAFTPPTLAPLATSGAASAACYPSTTNVNTSFASGNTELLTSMTNGAIFDNAMINDLETVGNAQISTSVVKFGTGSMYFDGTGDYLQIPSTPTFAFGTGDFTIEFWWYPLTSALQEAAFFTVGAALSSANAMSVFTDTSRGLLVYSGGSYIVSGYGSDPTLNQWNHMAVTRTSGTLRTFVNGIFKQSASFTNTINAAISFVGRLGSSAPYAPNGYIDDMRITTGYSRYSTSTNFTPPTAAFFNTGPN